MTVFPAVLPEIRTIDQSFFCSIIFLLNIYIEVKEMQLEQENIELKLTFDAELS
jgi:hypothetical protein